MAWSISTEYCTYVFSHLLQNNLHRQNTLGYSPPLVSLCGDGQEPEHQHISHYCWPIRVSTCVR